MADRRPPGFNVPLGFYDGPEVESIPRRIRAAAIGVWTLCGTFSANKLQDGYVGPAALKQLGCTLAIRSALKATLGPDGAPDPLWTDARGGGIQFTKWVKYQRSRAEVKVYRNADAERKRRERGTQRNRAGPPPPSEDTETSDRTSNGRPPDVQVESQTPKTKTKTDVTYVGNEHSLNVGAAERGGLSETVSQTASRLVAEIIPITIPAAVRTALRIQASQLINGDHTDSEIVGEGLRLWLHKPGAGPGLLPSLVADVIRARAVGNGKQPHKMRSVAELAKQERAREQAQMKELE